MIEVDYWGLNMSSTTTPNVEGKNITRYCGVVAGEAIPGENFLNDIRQKIRLAR
jgi:uncharacterized protein YbjQ (UPF0145 family)